MNYGLNEENKLIRQTVRDFAEREIKPKAAELDEKGEFSLDITKKMGELGLMGMNLPEEYGGQGMSTLSYIIAVEELARVDSSQAATLAAHNSLGIGPLYYYGSEEQKQKYLPKLCTGEALWAFGLTEPDAGSDSRATKTKAHLENDQWIINGSKIFITNGSTPISIGAIVQAVTNNEGGKKAYSVIIVEANTEGFSQVTMHNKMMWRASDTSELYFDNCKVPKENILGKEGQGSKIMLSTLDNGRLSIAAMGLGLAQGAYEMALQYAKIASKGKVISFEPTHYAISRFRRNLELNPELAQHITIINSFVSDKIADNPDIKAYSSWKIDGENQTNELHPIHLGAAKPTSGVGSTTLDDFCENSGIDKVDFIKIDTDGHEFEIFKGAKKTIAKYRPRIVFELGIYIMKEKGIDFLFYIEYFKRLNYKLIDTKTDKTLNIDNWNKLIPALGTTDVIAIPN